MSDRRAGDRLAQPRLAHQRGQDDARAHAARPRHRRGARRAARHRVRRRAHRWSRPRDGDRAARCGTRPASATACGWRDGCAQAGNPIGWFLSEVWDRWQRPRRSGSASRRCATSRDEADVRALPRQRLRGARGRRLRRARDGAARLDRQAGRRAAQPARRAARRRRRSRRGRALARQRSSRTRRRARRCCRSTPSRAAGCRRRRCSARRGGAARAAQRGRRWRGCAPPGGARRVATFDAAMQSLAASLARIATATRAGCPTAGGAARRGCARLGAALGIGSADAETPPPRAQRALAARLDAEVRANTRDADPPARPRTATPQGEILERLATSSTCACGSTRARPRSGAARSAARSSASRPTC